VVDELSDALLAGELLQYLLLTLQTVLGRTFEHDQLIGRSAGCI